MAVSCSYHQEIDRLAQKAFSIPALALMENAGYQSYLYLKHFLDKKPKELKADPLILFFIGSGNNGGDGLVMARHLSINHRQPIIIADTEKSSRSELNRIQFDTISKLGIPVYHYRDQWLSRIIGKLREGHGVVLVDALLGIGAVSRAAEGGAAVMIDLIKKIQKNPIHRSYTIALDIPSGIFTGFSSPEAEVASSASVVTADETLTFGLSKDLFYYPSISPLVGNIRLLNPGFPERLLKEAPAKIQIVDREMISDMIIPFKKSDYKKSKGRIGVVAGRKGMLGAAALCTEAAWKSGAGLVTLFCPQEDRLALIKLLPHTMVYSLDDFSRYQDRSGRGLADDFDTIVFGPGLGRPEDSKNRSQLEMILTEILNQSVPAVIDADGIYYYKKILTDGKSPEKKPGKKAASLLTRIAQTPVTLTPHIGEMRGLLAGIESLDPGVDPFAAAEKFFQRYGLRQTLAVVKSHLVYVIPPQKISGKPSPPYVVEGKNPLLGVGGSGDILAGIIASLTARQVIHHGKGLIPRLRGAVAGAYFHQEAGRRAGERLKIFTSKELLGDIPFSLAEFLNV